MFIRLARHALIAALAAGASCAAAVTLPQAAVAAARAPATTVTYTNLTLINGWHTDTLDGAGKPAVANISGIITLKGAISSSSTNPVAFVLPKAFRPAADVYVPVDLCDANFGRLHIKPNGVAEVAVESVFSNATCFTSLDGVSFAKSGTSFTTLALKTGWTAFGGGTAKPQARVISGIVHLRGAIRGNLASSAIPFILPKAFRPAASVFVSVDMCNAAKGQLTILPSGEARVLAEQTPSTPTCLVSLDGVSFAKSTASFTPLTLLNGWHRAGPGVFKAAVRVINGVVHFEGGIATSGTTPVLFTLPKALRPAHNVWTAVDLCTANNGRLAIQTDGVVSIEEEGSTFSNAACFTSLDGAWFAR